MSPDPELYIHPLDAAREGIDGGAWVRVSTLHGSIELKARIDDAQKPGSLRVPHGWWLPESARDLGRGLGKSTLHNDGMLIPDDCWNLDREQGLANLRGGLHAKVEAI
jgi:anaerobic selenocysteine-containing dehydrogenase